MNDECICIGFSINKRCRVHGNPESVMANEMIRARKSINLQIKDLQQKLNQETLRREEAEKVISDIESECHSYQEDIEGYQILEKIEEYKDKYKDEK